MKRTVLLLPKQKRVLGRFGESLKLARLRRRLNAQLVAERAGISRATLVKVESGEPSVAMGTYFQVMHVLGLDDDFEKLAEDDVLGRKLQDLDLVTKKRAPKRKVSP